MKSFVTLSEKERQFIVVATMRAHNSVREIADILGWREHTARNIQRSLLSRGIIASIPMIDIYRIGFTDFRVFLSDIAETSRVKSIFEKRVLNYPQVYWLAKMNGAFQYAITLLAREPFEMIDFFAAIQPPEDGFYARRTIGIAATWTVFSPSYLAPELGYRESINLTARERVPELEEEDHLILAHIARNPSASTAALARSARIKESTLAYRLKRLTELQVLRGQVYLLRCSEIGVLVYRVMIVDRGLSVQQREKLCKYLSQHPNVVAMLRCTGGWDYEIRLEMHNAEVLEEFCQAIVDGFGRVIGSILSAQQVSILKRASYPCQ